MKSIHSIYIVLFVLLCHVPIGHAHQSIDDNGGYCQNAKTTADLVQCSATRLAAENDRLAKLYNAVQAIYSADDDADIKQTIAKNQTDWVTYRDTVCAVEAKQYEGGSLSLVQETSCLARVTSDRANHFLVMLRARDDAAIPVFSNPPRWVNVLGEDYADVYWAIASKQTIDTDCDGMDEVMISGLRAVNDQGAYQTIIAIADSEKTGRPKVSLLQFEDKNNCNIGMGVEIEPIAQGDGDTQMCKQRVSLVTQNCGAFTVEYDNDTKAYILQNNEMNEKTETNEQKN